MDNHFGAFLLYQRFGFLGGGLGNHNDNWDE